MRWQAAVAVGALLALEACSLVKPTPAPVIDGKQVGVASWYGPGFHGRRTANGEVYDQYELTAAHPSLPLGTRAMVTSLANGRSVEVRINDRGPFVGGRIVDLSYAAARVIGMVGPGTMPVRLEVIDSSVQVAARRPGVGLAGAEPEPSPSERRPARAPQAPQTEVSAPAAEAARSFGVLVATLGDESLAEHLRSRIALKFPDARVSPIDVGTDRHYRVRIGPYASRSIAVARAELVNRYGYPAVITELEAP